MTDLVDEVKASFESAKDDVRDDESPVTFVRADAEDLAPGFPFMQEYFAERLLAVARRGYRFHAGSTMPTNAEELIERTSEQMVPPLVATSIGAFTDGVMLGHQNDHLVKLCFYFDSVEHLYHDSDFRATSLRMAMGFAGDSEVADYFSDYVLSSLLHMSHVTGFAHREVDPGKVWDIWLLSGTACVTACFLAGTKLGTSWRERDVLDGIAIASEEDSRGSDGEAEPSN